MSEFDMSVTYTESTCFVQGKCLCLSNIYSCDIASSPSPSTSESECCGATQHNNQLGATGRQTDLKQRALAQQARTPSCGGHGVSHARLPGRPLGPRRDLLTSPSLHREDLERMVSTANLLLTLALELLHSTSEISQILRFADILQPPGSFDKG